MRKLRVLVVEDSLTIRGRLVEVLSADPDMQVVGEAGDGKIAIELCQQLRPDIVTLDMLLPVLSGLAVTELHYGVLPNTHPGGFLVDQSRRPLQDLRCVGGRGAGCPRKTEGR
jgi:DNA-binding NarL/FixJ family response regulator